MAGIKIDISKFKHLKSDKHSTTLQHPDGHQITLAHGALSKQTQAQLDALSKVSKDAETPLQADETKHTQAMAAGGEIKDAPKGQDSREDKGWGAIVVKPSDDSAAPMAEGGEILKENYDHSCEGKSYCTHCGGKMPKMYADGTDNVSAEDSAPQAPAAISADPIQSQDAVPGVPTDINKIAQATKVDAAKSAVPQDVQDKRKIYNMLAATSLGSPEGYLDDSVLFGPNGEAPKQFDADTWQKAEIAKQAADVGMQKKNAEDYQEAVKTNQARAAAGLAPLPLPDNAGPVPGSQMTNLPTTLDQDPKAGLASATSAPVSGSGGGLPTDPEAMLTSGYKNTMQGINESAKVQGQLGHQNAQILGDQVQAQQQAQQAYQGAYQELEQERQAHMQDIKDGYIDPNKYWDNHSKIASGIGMILAGFNPTTAPNAAVNFLKFQMEQNLQAQQRNLGAKENLLSANLRQFGNLRDATDMTRLMQADIVHNELLQAAAKAQTPAAAAAAKQAAGQLQMQMAPQFQAFAMRRAMMNMANAGNQSPQAIEHMIGYMRPVNPEMAKEMEGRFVPDVGLGSVPVPNEVRSQLISGEQLQNTAQDLLNYSKAHSNVLPGTAAYNTGVQKAAILQQKIREGLLGTVFRESEKPLLNKLVDDNPAGFMKSISTQPKLRQILESNALQLNTLKKNYGLPESKVAAEPQYKVVNGVKYMRGPNGEAIPVK